MALRNADIIVSSSKKRVALRKGDAVPSMCVDYFPAAMKKFKVDVENSFSP